MQDDVGKDEVGESPFGCDAQELGLVLRVRLEAQAHCKDRICKMDSQRSRLTPRLPPRTKQLMVEMNPDRNELKGKVPTRTQ